MEILAAGLTVAGVADAQLASVQQEIKYFLYKICKLHLLEGAGDDIIG